MNELQPSRFEQNWSQSYCHIVQFITSRFTVRFVSFCYRLTVDKIFMQLMARLELDSDGWDPTVSTSKFFYGFSKPKSSSSNWCESISSGTTTCTFAASIWLSSSHSQRYIVLCESQMGRAGAMGDGVENILRGQRPGAPHTSWCWLWYRPQIRLTVLIRQQWSIIVEGLWVNPPLAKDSQVLQVCLNPMMLTSRYV